MLNICTFKIFCTKLQLNDGGCWLIECYYIAKSTLRRQCYVVVLLFIVFQLANIQASFMILEKQSVCLHRGLLTKIDYDLNKIYSEITTEIKITLKIKIVLWWTGTAFDCNILIKWFTFRRHALGMFTYYKIPEGRRERSIANQWFVLFLN